MWSKRTLEILRFFMRSNVKEGPSSQTVLYRDLSKSKQRECSVSTHAACFDKALPLRVLRACAGPLFRPPRPTVIIQGGGNILQSAARPAL